MAYCASCGKLHGGGLLCSRCATDMEKSGKTVEAMVEESELTLKYLESSARRNSGSLSVPTLIACQNAEMNGSEYGWE